MEQIPDDLLNAARIDGMNEFMIFFKIAIPQVWPALAALSIFTFLGNWNAFLWPLIVIESEALRCFLLDYLSSRRGKRSHSGI